jgi:hypothetical protein
VASQVTVDLVELNSEAANLDLVVGSASDGAITRVIEVVSEITSPVHPVAWPFVELPPGLCGVVGGFVIGLNPLVVVDEPVVKELLLGLLLIIEISVRRQLAGFT